MRSWFGFVVLCLLSAPVLAIPRDLVKAELLADVSGLEAGKAFTVGVELIVKPNWHIYWVNAGESGMPTKVEFTLPEGFVAGEVQYPVPLKFVQAGDIIGFGYHDKVMLIATITPPKELPAGQTVSLKAKVSWLSCEKV